MICTTCGADNPGHLTFCRECGQRLAARVAPPTPPVGLGHDGAGASAPSPLAATAVAPPENAAPTPSPHPSSPVPRHRPTAPEMSFRPRSDEPAPPPPVPAMPAPAAAGVTCPLCGTTSQAGLRFCVTCGQSLGSPLAAAGPTRAPIDLSRTVPEPPRFVEPAPAPPTPTPPPIAPVRVVGLGAPETPPMQRLCPRCRGASDAAAQFCRFCGSSLAEAQSVALQPSPNPISSPPPPLRPMPAPPTAPATPQAIAAAAAALRSGEGPRTNHTTARLVLIARDGGEGPSHPIGETTDIGRTEGTIVIAEDRYISPRHARISFRNDAFYLRDLESTNGVFVRIPFQGVTQPEMPSGGEQVLADQDLFLVGQQVLRFEVVKHAEEGFGIASDNGTLVFGTPAAPRYARLSQRTVEGVVRDVFHVRKTETVLGREQGDIVFPDDPFLSRRHCMLRVHGATPPSGSAASRRFTLSDLGSSNGTFLQVREEVRLRPGDHFRIGQQLFRFDT
ncbi:MAG TPA: FHA domain-containing protein [Polyangiaceae bacterium]|nr:FHA domain-containing protein [Polyangiaceae bacterium]